MSTKKSSSAGNPGGEAGQGAPADLIRQQLAVFTDGMSAMFSAAQALQAMQQEMFYRATQRQIKAVEQLRSSKNPIEALTVQVDLLTTSVQDALQVWTQLAAVPTRTQAAASTNTGQAEGAASVASLNPMIQAWQTMLDSSLAAASPTHH